MGLASASGDGPRRGPQLRDAASTLIHPAALDGGRQTAMPMTARPAMAEPELGDVSDGARASGSLIVDEGAHLIRSPNWPGDLAAKSTGRCAVRDPARRAGRIRRAAGIDAWRRASTCCTRSPCSGRRQLYAAFTTTCCCSTDSIIASWANWVRQHQLRPARPPGTRAQVALLGAACLPALGKPGGGTSVSGLAMAYSTRLMLVFGVGAGDAQDFFALPLEVRHVTRVHWPGSPSRWAPRLGCCARWHSGGAYGIAPLACLT